MGLLIIHIMMILPGGPANSISVYLWNFIEKERDRFNSSDGKLVLKYRGTKRIINNTVGQSWLEFRRRYFEIILYIDWSLFPYLLIRAILGKYNWLFCCFEGALIRRIRHLISHSFECNLKFNSIDFRTWHSVTEEAIQVGGRGQHWMTRL